MHFCLCGSTTFTVLGAKDAREVGRCESCGLVQTLNPPDDYSALYTQGDTYHQERRGQTPYYERFEHDVAVGDIRLERHLRSLRWLDVGCANGGFLTSVRERLHAQVEGIEPNPHMAAWARRQTGATVHESWETVSGVFDFISYHDVIEHVPDPVGELTRAGNSLAPRGLLILDTPDAEHFTPDLMTSHHMKPQEHLWFFREVDLRRVVQCTGLLVESVERPIPGKLVIYARKVI